MAKKRAMRDGRQAASGSDQTDQVDPQAAGADAETPVAPQAPSAADSLIASIEAATPATLEAIDRKIALLEDEFDKVRRRINGELKALNTLRRVVNLKVNGAQPRGAGVRGVKAGRVSRAGSGGSPANLGGNSECVAQIGGRHTGPPSHADTKLISRIIQELARGGPMSDEAMASRVGESVAAVRQSVSRCPGQVKRFTDERLALPGHPDPRRE